MTYRNRILHYLRCRFELPDAQIAGMLPGFKSTLVQHMQHLDAVSQSADWEGVAKAAHTIKGAFLSLGLAECAALAIEIETAAPVAALQGYEQLDQKIEKLRGWVQDIVSEPD